MTATDTVTRFVVTFVHRCGERRIAGAVQARNTFATEGAALRSLNDLLENADNDIPGVFGPQSVGTFEVRPVECWPNTHDPKTCYFE